MTTATDPQITIGITCYREGEWLRDCWESVLAQTDDRWEAVMVLDGGHDERTRTIFESIEHPKLRKFVFPENVGPYPVRNKAFELTQTPYHFYCDGDDLLVPNSVERVLDTFSRNPDAAVVYGNYEFFRDPNITERLEQYPPYLTAQDIAAGRRPAGPGAYSKSIWENVGRFPAELARGSGDIDYFISLLEGGYGLRNAGSVIYRYRLTDGGVNMGNLGKKYRIREHIVDRHRRFFADPALTKLFLTKGYMWSYASFYNQGLLREAREVARHALARDCCGKMKCSMQALSVLPLPVFRILRRLRRRFRYSVNR